MEITTQTSKTILGACVGYNALTKNIMTKEKFNQLALIQKGYEEAYNKKWNEVKGTSPIRIVHHESPLDDNSPIKKVYENEGNFFLCGYNSLYFSPVGNAGLKPALIKLGYAPSKRYYGGLSFRLNQIGNRGNGDFTIQEYAYGEVCKYLNLIGFEVYQDSRLD